MAAAVVVKLRCPYWLFRHAEHLMIAAIFMVTTAAVLTKSYYDQQNAHHQLRFLSAMNAAGYHQHYYDGARPIFVIHVGPFKTGTTFLQSTLCSKEADAVVAADHFYFIGTCMMSFVRDDKLKFGRQHLFDTTTNATDPVISQELRKALAQMRLNQQSGILVHEGLHALPPLLVETLAKELNKDWRVVVVQGYRPVAEWLVSRWNQWLRDNHYLGRWPDEPESLQPELKFGLSTNTDFDDLTESIALSGQSVFENTQSVWKTWFPDFQTIDMKHLPERADNADPYLMHFLCNVISTAPSLCREAPRLAEIAGRPNESNRWEYQALASWLWRLYELDAELEKMFVVNEIRKYHQEQLNNTALEMSCPSYSDLDTLWQWTLRADRNLFPSQDGREEREQNLRSLFEQDLRSNKFCTVDAAAVWMRSDWEPLLRELTDRKAEQ